MYIRACVWSIILLIVPADYPVYPIKLKSGIGAFVGFTFIDC